MAFTYQAFADTETDRTAQIVPMTPDNIYPAMILWLAVSLNIKGQYFLGPDPPRGEVNDDDKDQLAQTLGVTRNTVDRFFKLASGGYGESFANTSLTGFEDQVANAGDDPYGHVGCPADIQPLLRLARFGVKGAAPAAVRDIVSTDGRQTPSAEVDGGAEGSALRA